MNKDYHTLGLATINLYTKLKVYLCVYRLRRYERQRKK